MEKKTSESDLDRLMRQFHASIDTVISTPALKEEMLGHLSAFNPKFVPVSLDETHPKTEVLANVVSAIYAPLMHGFATAILRNIQSGALPPYVIAPPRDSIPLLTALQAQADLQGVSLTTLTPHVNRNTGGIANNQRTTLPSRSPHLDTLLDQVMRSLGKSNAVLEIETGIYGTTSKVTAEGLKARGLQKYIPLKFYGLGPNMSYVHAILSGGTGCWVAEELENSGGVDISHIKDL
ncbi:MAG: hypothetical protein ACMG6E_05420, partial [Candidatus Roizmanbacteria bacterium]